MTKGTADTLKGALLVGFIAGFASFLLSQVLAGIGTSAIGSLVLALLLVVVLLAAKKHVKIDEISVFDLVLFVATICALRKPVRFVRAASLGLHSEHRRRSNGLRTPLHVPVHSDRRDRPREDRPAEEIGPTPLWSRGREPCDGRFSSLF